ncbi:CGNR zinc finger domain-containing protein [Chondrinema litorale]|uniref:CGNR zinc finger domain-containing protein n=1 Tax=Chondrinema litorale TaxID=2994555 RepID=UPI002543CBB9|nr:CGNR zinc finger domain-containing protein [Chondrinema litorale]UZR98600.1 CGNR zinc finger domain-containing protein [Chondrinema litorale]
MESVSNIHILSISGGHLSFDFINTVSSRQENSENYDYFQTYHDFLLWCQRLEILTEESTDNLSTFSKRHPKITDQTLSKIVAVREDLYILFFHIVKTGIAGIPEKVLQKFNYYVSEALSQIKLDLKDDKFVSSFSDLKNPLEEPLCIILKTTADLLMAGDYQRIKQCGNCDWLFLDTTKNNKKRWCSASTCGSVEKSKRYYQKRKSKKTS